MTIPRLPLSSLARSIQSAAVGYVASPLPELHNVLQTPFLTHFYSRWLSVIGRVSPYALTGRDQLMSVTIRLGHIQTSPRTNCMALTMESGTILSST